MKTTLLRFALGAVAVVGVTAGAASAQCPAADAFEPNDDCLTATAVTPGSYTNLTLNGPMVLENQDFYSISVPNGEIITVDLTFATATGDIDVYLYDSTTPNCGGTATGDYLIRGFTGSDNESISWTNSTGAAETYTIMVDAWDSDSDFDCNDYSMDITVAPDPCTTAVDDGLEENDACGAAVALATGATASLFVSDVDEDYYSISVPAGNILSVDVSYSTANADVDLELFDDLACANQVDFSFSAGGAGNATWNNTTGAAVTAILRVAPDVATGTCNNYDLNVAITPDPCAGSDDGLEDNDDCASAVAMNDGTTAGLFVSKTDHDYYQFVVADGDTLTVDILFTDALGDLDMELYMDNADCVADVNVAGSFSVDDNESVSYTNTSGGQLTMYAHIYHWQFDSSADCNVYDLVVTGSGGSAATPFCPGDGSAGACPCGNESALGAGEGCNSSLGFGAVLTATGSASVANDDMVFTLSQARPNQPSLLVQGSVAIAVPFKDGLLCMGNPTERLEVVFLDGTGSGSTTVSIVTEGNVSAGQTRYYQQWFRDPGGVSPCGSGSNFSGGLTVVWM